MNKDTESPQIKLGILGGGQLGRMSSQAAKKINISTTILTPEENSPASQVADKTIISPYENEEALKEFAHGVDFITYEFENIPLKTVEFLSSLKPTYPDANLLLVSQDRIKEKTFLNMAGIPTAKWAEIQSKNDLSEFLHKSEKRECIIKTTRFGYDGKGQARVNINDNLEQIVDSFKPLKLIAEEIIDFDCEISVIIARDQFGKMQTYGPVLNEHKNHILNQSVAPAPIDSTLIEKAIAITSNLAEEINLRGVLALEMFVTQDGQILANEIAPRTHNSGHWSIDACEVSQFENFVRAVCGLEIMPPNQHSHARMLNLIGNDIENTKSYKEQSNAYIHDYGKNDIKEGRKMGHVTFLDEK